MVAIFINTAVVLPNRLGVGMPSSLLSRMFTLKEYPLRPSAQSIFGSHVYSGIAFPPQIGDDEGCLHYQIEISAWESIHTQCSHDLLCREYGVSVIVDGLDDCFDHGCHHKRGYCTSLGRIEVDHSTGTICEADRCRVGVHCCGIDNG